MWREVDLMDVPYKTPGCYALYKRGKLVYIGSSVVIRTRLMEHTRLRSYSSIKIRPCQRDWESLERRLIRRLKPVRNTKLYRCRPMKMS